MRLPLLRFITLRQKTDYRGKTRWMADKFQPVCSLNHERYREGDGKKYPILLIQNEKQLAEFIKEKIGYGLVAVFGYLKGKGMRPWIFWKGEISEDGWVAVNRDYLGKEDKKEIKEWEKDISNTQDEEEKQILERDINELKNLSKEINRGKRYGFYNFIKSSGRRGQMNYWNDVEIKIEEDIKKKEFDDISQNIVIRKTTKNKVSFDNMSIDDINKF